MRRDWGFSALVARATAPAAPVYVAVAFAPKAQRGGCFAWVGLFVVAFAAYCMVRF